MCMCFLPGGDTEDVEHVCMCFLPGGDTEDVEHMCMCFLPGGDTEDVEGPGDPGMSEPARHRGGRRGRQSHTGEPRQARGHTGTVVLFIFARSKFRGKPTRDHSAWS